GTYCVNGSVGGASSVGSRSTASSARWGHLDLAGNVWEWVLDWHADSYPMPCDDCANLTASTYRVMRGGRFLGDAPSLRVGNRWIGIPPYRNADLGFRCARNAP